jgi:hypothetical protein
MVSGLCLQLTSTDVCLGSGGAQNLKTVMGASTSKGMARKGIRSSKTTRIHSFFEREACYVDTSTLLRTCTVIGAIRLQNRDTITHRDRTEKVTEQYIDRNRTCILQLTERSEARGRRGKNGYRL